MADDERDDSPDAPALRALTARERRFVDELSANGWNKTAAARAAGYMDGPNLRVTACKLAQRPAIAAAIDAKLAELATDARLRTEAVLDEIAEVAYAPLDPSIAGPKIRALELLGKAGKAFADRVSLENPDGSAVVPQSLTIRFVKADGSSV